MASDIYIKLDEVDGESTDSKHAGWIELQSFSWGATQSASPSAASHAAHSSARVDISDFNINKYADKASPKLFLNCATGKHIKSATVEICKATGDGGQVPYLTYKLEDVIISSYASGAGAGGGLPSESLSLKAGKFLMEYAAVTDKGKVEGKVAGGWDLATNKKI